jgi:hypothetical protein
MDEHAIGPRLWHLIVKGRVGYGGGYRYSYAEKAGLFLVCLAQRLKPRRNLLAGPFAGEFGYEVMQWQGFVRARRRHYEAVHVLTYPGRDYLYEGCQVHPHDTRLDRAGYLYGQLNRWQAREIATAKAVEIGLEDYDIFEPSLLCTQYHKRVFGRQDFRLLEEPPLTKAILDVAFHFRAVRKQGPDQENKNYLPAMADKLVAGCLARGISVSCIGHPEYAYCPAGCPDHRSVDLRRTVAAISSVRAVAGENSGPMHLANLCGKPTILWAQHQWRIAYSLRWNPFRVPIYIAANDTSQPPPALVATAIEKSLKDLREKSGDFTRPLYALPAQPIAYY